MRSIVLIERTEAPQPEYHIIEKVITTGGWSDVGLDLTTVMLLQRPFSRVHYVPQVLHTPRPPFSALVLAPTAG